MRRLLSTLPPREGLPSPAPAQQAATLARWGGVAELSIDYRRVMREPQKCHIRFELGQSLSQREYYRSEVLGIQVTRCRVRYESAFHCLQFPETSPVTSRPRPLSPRTCSYPRATKHADQECGPGAKLVIHSCEVTSDIPFAARRSSTSGRNRYRMRWVSRSVSTVAVFRS